MPSNEYKARQLAIRQALPLKDKVKLSERRIAEWVNHHGIKNVYVSFSGGKDSTVLLDIARRMYPEIPAAFVDTGLEFPEIRDFIKTFDNVDWIKPKMPFTQVLKHYGYPVVSKEVSHKVNQLVNTKSDKLRDIRLKGSEKGHGKLSLKWQYLQYAPFKISGKCCDVMKKTPFKKYEKETGRHPIIGTMASDSRLRRQTYFEEGCNAFGKKRGTSKPLSFWLDSDVWTYLLTERVPYSDIYNMGYCGTGCAFCAFGCHLDNKNKFQLMKETHPKLWAYCMDKLGMREVLQFIGVASE